ncbi:MAG: gamma-glutamyl-gamma-aminobutyrate hydrolase family protein [Alphaproteobacteria bacterium]|nr:gamma-glutamyl-gamma-aminobutyrate hydrolase family protein [Alphaproteobacteria bacterium]
MQRVCLEYLPEFQAWGVKKEVIAKLAAKGQVAEIVFPKLEEIEKAKAKYPELKDFNYNPKATAPTAGFLLGQDKADDGTEYYSISNAYAQAMANTGAKIRFLDYENPEKQMVGCHGAVLPGGVFDSPRKFETDPADDLDELLKAGALSFDWRGGASTPGKRYEAYRSVIRHIDKTKKPMLGICAGAQMVAALLGGWHMYGHTANMKWVSSFEAITHKKKGYRHTLYLKSGSPFYQALNLQKDVKQVLMNTRHVACLVPEVEQKTLQLMTKKSPRVELEVFATTKDGVPEILGNLARSILLVQGHPEDYAKVGRDGKPNFYQNIYNWMASQATAYQKQQWRRMAKQLGRAKG